MGGRVQVDVGALSQEIGEMNRWLQERASSARQCVDAIQAYCSEARLKGAAYESSKRYYEQTHIRLCTQITGVCEELISLNNTVLPRFSSYVPDTNGFAADTEVIETEIERLRAENDDFRGQIEYYSGQMLPATAFYTPPDYSGIILMYMGRIAINELIIDRLQRIVDGLRAFDSDCAGMYSEADALLQALSGAIEALNSADTWNVDENQYVVPSTLSQKLEALEYEKLVIRNPDGTVNYQWTALEALLEGDVRELSAEQLSALHTVFSELGIYGKAVTLSPATASDYKGFVKAFGERHRPDAWRLATNYVYNIQVDLSQCVGQYGTLNGQGQKDFQSMHIGSQTVAYAGCGAIAIYNALRSIGKEVTLADVIYTMEKGGYLVLDSQFGANIYSTADILQEYGVESERVSVDEFLSADFASKAQEGDTYVAAIMNDGEDFTQLGLLMNAMNQMRTNPIAGQGMWDNAVNRQTGKTFDGLHFIEISYHQDNDPQGSWKVANRENGNPDVKAYDELEKIVDANPLNGKYLTIVRVKGVPK